MAQIPEVKVEPRNLTGKGAAGRIRREGKVPCVVYGRGVENELLAISDAELARIVHAHGMLNLNIEGVGSRSVVVRDLQHNYLAGTVLHVDFQVVRLDEKIRNTIPLVAVGEAAGLAQGGIVEQFMHEIEVECFPQHLPERIECDVTGLDVGGVITVSQLLMPENVVAVYSNPDIPAFVCDTPREEEEEAAPAAAEEAAAAEPAVIEKGKKEEEEKA